MFEFHSDSSREPLFGQRGMIYQDPFAQNPSPFVPSVPNTRVQMQQVHALQTQFDQQHQQFNPKQQRLFRLELITFKITRVLLHTTTYTFPNISLMSLTLYTICLLDKPKVIISLPGNQIIVKLFPQSLPPVPKLLRFLPISLPLQHMTFPKMFLLLNL